MKKLSFKGILSMILVLPVMVAMSILLFVLVYMIKIMIWIFKFIGIIDALDYLSYKIKQKQKWNSFFNSLTEDDKNTMKNG